MNVLVTGGAGYIGIHTCLALLEAGFRVVVVDDLSNAVLEAVLRVERLSDTKIPFYQVDVTDKQALSAVFEKHPEIDAVIHFAAKKAVGESCVKPLMYYHNNVTGSLVLCDVMKAHGVRSVVFSSSATVYGYPEQVPVAEGAEIRPTNPYGQTKAMVEQIFADVAKAEDWGVGLLRYFNPVGAHESGEIGEDPAYPNNLVPFVSQVAAGLREKVVIFGDDYDTPDGTGVRDYIHVSDLAVAHVKALQRIHGEKGAFVYNIGTGRGYSVLEIVEMFRKISGQAIPVEIGARRSGDVPTLTADPTLAAKELKWNARYGLEEMIRSAWHWQSKNPQGFRGSEPSAAEKQHSSASEQSDLAVAKQHSSTEKKPDVGEEPAAEQASDAKQQGGA